MSLMLDTLQICIFESLISCSNNPLENGCYSFTESSSNRSSRGHGLSALESYMNNNKTIRRLFG